jgi:hypothetical protein
MQSITTAALNDPCAMMTALRASALDITNAHIPTVRARSDRLLSSAVTQEAVYVADVDSVIKLLAGQYDKARCAMQRGVATCVKRVDANVDVVMVSGGQLESMGRLCEATFTDNAVHVMKMADAVCEFRAVDTALRMPAWCQSESGLSDVRCAIDKVLLSECDVDKGACVVRGRGVEAYVSHNDEHNNMRLVCVTSEGVPVPYISAGDVGLEFVGGEGCFGECVGCEIMSPGVIEMVYRVEGTGDLQLTTKLFGEVIVVSKMDLDKYVYASWSLPIYTHVQTMRVREVNMFPGSVVLAGLVECREVDVRFSEWLPKKKMRLLYRSSRDGASAAPFHRLCNGQGPTVTMIKSSGGYVFGGYSGVAWSSVGRGHACPSAFLFTVTNPHGDPITRFMSNGDDEAVYCHSGFGPTFGGGPDLYVTGAFYGTSFTNFPISYTDTRWREDATFTGALYFTPAEVEVWAVE